MQSETVERYVREGMILPDLVVPMSEHRTFKYFKEETLEAAAEKYGWTLIDDSNRKAKVARLEFQFEPCHPAKGRTILPRAKLPRSWTWCGAWT